MSKDLEGMFKKIPFEKAYRKCKEYERKLEELQAQGASVFGKRGIDKRYTNLMGGSVRYLSRFTDDEASTLMAKNLLQRPYPQNSLYAILKSHSPYTLLILMSKTLKDKPLKDKRKK